MGEDDNGETGEGFSETNIKDPWTKPSGAGIRGRRWGCLGWWESGEGKCRQLYFKNNKIIF